MNTNFHHSPANLLALLQEARRRTDLPPEVPGRLEALLAYAQSGSVSSVCRRYGISRQTFYRWLHRFDARDLLSLADHPKFFAKPTPSSLPVVQAGATLSDPEPVEGKSHRWKPALLAGSLALNVLLAGIGIGLLLGKNIEQEAQPASLIEVRPARHSTPRTGTGATTSAPICTPIRK